MLVFLQGFKDVSAFPPASAEIDQVNALGIPVLQKPAAILVYIPAAQRNQAYSKRIAHGNVLYFGLLLFRLCIFMPSKKYESRIRNQKNCKLLTFHSSSPLWLLNNSI